MIPPLTTTLDELERLLAAATPGPWRVGWDEYIEHQSEDKEDFPEDGWANLHWDHEGLGATWRTDHDAALIVAAVNALPALIAAAKENLRPRWHHDWDLPPEDRHYCEECSALITEVRQLRAAQPAPPTEALDTLQRIRNRLHNLRYQGLTDDLLVEVLAIVDDEARRYLAATEEGT